MIEFTTAFTRWKKAVACARVSKVKCRSYVVGLKECCTQVTYTSHLLVTPVPEEALEGLLARDIKLGTLTPIIDFAFILLPGSISNSKGGNNDGTKEFSFDICSAPSVLTS